MDKDFEFDLKDGVFIHPFEVPGIVIAIHLSGLGTQYRVRFFIDSKLKTMYFFEEELSELVDDDNKKITFPGV